MPAEHEPTDMVVPHLPDSPRRTTDRDGETPPPRWLVGSPAILKKLIVSALLRVGVGA